MDCGLQVELPKDKQPPPVQVPARPEFGFVWVDQAIQSLSKQVGVTICSWLLLFERRNPDLAGGQGRKKKKKKRLTSECTGTIERPHWSFDSWEKLPAPEKGWKVSSHVTCEDPGLSSFASHFELSPLNLQKRTCPHS